MSNQALGEHLDTLLTNINQGLMVREPKSVRCCDCAFEPKIRLLQNDDVGKLTGTGYCETADMRLVGWNRNGKALRQPRRCQPFEPKQKGVQKNEAH